MILQICGNIIDTQYIYSISICHAAFDCCVFDISFINQKSISITRQINAPEPFNFNEYTERKNKSMAELSNVRDQLICKWKANQLSIPKIEFDESTFIT